MYKKTFLICLLLAVMITSCASRTDEFATNQPTNVISAPTQTLILRPNLSGWRIVGMPTISGDDFKLAIHGIQLDNQATIVFYSICGLRVDDIVDFENIQVTENISHTSRVFEVVPFPVSDKVELGVMVFEPRTVAATELYIKIKTLSANMNMDQALFAQRDGNIEDTNNYPARTYSLAVEDALKGTDCNISFNSWEAVSAQKSASQEANTGSSTLLSTPTAVLPGASSDDSDVRSTMTFRVETIDKQVRYISIQLLVDGSAIVTLDGKAVRVAPAYIDQTLNTPTATTPYP